MEEDPSQVVNSFESSHSIRRPCFNSARYMPSSLFSSKPFQLARKGLESSVISDIYVIWRLRIGSWKFTARRAFPERERARVPAILFSKSTCFPCRPSVFASQGIVREQAWVQLTMFANTAPPRKTICLLRGGSSIRILNFCDTG